MKFGTDIRVIILIEMMRQRRSIYYYKWEFLRRDKNYKKDYAGYKVGKIARHEIMERYDITPADYRKSYSTLTKPGEKEPLVFRAQYRLFNILQPDAWSEQSLEEKVSNLQNIKFESLEPGKLPDYKEMKSLRIILDVRYPKIVLVDRFEKFISLYQRFVKKFPIGIKRTKKDKNDYDKYLKVYVLHESPNNWDWEKLAEKFYKGDIENNGVNYAKKKVKRDYDRCKNLIEGGWRHLS